MDPIRHSRCVSMAKIPIFTSLFVGNVSQIGAKVSFICIHCCNILIG